MPTQQWLETKIPPPVVMVLVAAMMWIFARCNSAAHFYFPRQVEIAISIAIIGLLLMVFAIAAFIQADTTVNPLQPVMAKRLLTEGVFAFSRNPIYLADVLMLTAWLVWLGNFLNIIGLVLFVAYISRFQILPEERAMKQLFGEEYEHYCRKVRRWL